VGGFEFCDQIRITPTSNLYMWVTISRKINLLIAGVIPKGGLTLWRKKLVY